ncbi:6-phosphogluconolactonase [Geomonas sp. RF6]|uniref:6-phosphogluconolactonase n=1 Tax=Geomonas sp. RF6 TaxID=2897342 RepID=UPI001E331975|nr:6-phosphogluconolactonase [Geomonas sp. RF6]UFS69941.1 6-phosphogluconolactonase [Geomonas sp. RF6]
MLKIYDDHETLSRAAAELFAQEARRVVPAAGSFSVCISGGETPRRAYQLLAEKPLRSHIPWHGVQVFFADERLVPHADERSNVQMARRALLDHVPLAESQIRAIPTEGEPERCASRYEAMLMDHFAGRPPRFDLVLLGLGGDGHTASLFPGTPALDEAERWVAPVYQEGAKMNRVTLTAPILNQAAKVAFIVSGSEKAAVLKEVLEGDAQLPARLIAPVRGELLWLVDREAARLLE